tara:strand:- start:2701 stop:3054 length:354 start_codon:yes stop_codon:yes gene_type:complete
MVERRKYVRFRASFLFKFKNHAPNGAQGVVKDVSMSGLRVVLDKSVELDSNSQLNFYLLLPSQTFEISGETVWVDIFDNRKEAGIHFTNIADSYKEDIYNYISKYYREELVHKWWQS